MDGKRVSEKPSAPPLQKTSVSYILSDPFAHVIIILALGFVIYMSTSEAPFDMADGRVLKLNPYFLYSSLSCDNLSHILPLLDHLIH